MGSKFLSSLHNFLIFMSLSSFLCNETQNLIKSSYIYSVWLCEIKLLFVLQLTAAYLCALHYVRPRFQCSPQLHERRLCVCLCVFKLSFLCVWWVDAKYIVLITKIQRNKNNAICNNLFFMCMRCADRSVLVQLSSPNLKDLLWSVLTQSFL